MRQGLLFNDVDVAQVVLYIFFIFFAGSGILTIAVFETILKASPPFSLCTFLI